ncbi:MAG TPA: response regulator [Chitinophagaceae bacterium]|nr:response regulator [Chitinophagaceae bacterium]
MNTSLIIYIIDDDTDDQDFLIEAIKEIDASIECYSAMNGQEGLNKLETGAIPFPSLIFLDLNMPRIGGYKFLTAIKEHSKFKSIPVVIYTTSDNEKDRHEMLQLGAMDYVVKQASFSLLMENLHTIFLWAAK